MDTLKETSFQEETYIIIRKELYAFRDLYIIYPPKLVSET